MLKITPLSRKGRGQTLKVEGEIREFSVGIVRDACTKHASRSKRLHLDLANVLYVDPLGVELLRDLMREGIKITACSTFVAELLRLKQT